ncbi:MAG: choice-of-anchor D domain-containing protein, partial [Myxococcales bacterium]
MRRCVKWVAVLTVAGVVASAALSQGVPAPEWVSTGGPVGGLGYDVRIHPTTKSKMLVTDNYAGVALSSDSGKTWRPSNAGITVKGGATADAVAVFSLTVDPNDPDIVWAGTTGDALSYGVFKSTDGGAHWTAKINGIANTPYGIVFRGFTVQPGNSSVVYTQAELPSDPVTGHGREFNKVQGVVYKTTDGGDSWSQIWLGNNLARYLIIDPTDANTLYLSTGIFDREAYDSSCAPGLPGGDGLIPGAGGVGVMKSTNGGASWSPMNTGLVDLYVGSLRMHPTDHLTLFAATGANACSWDGTGHVVSGLFKTTDGGASWSKVVSDEIMTAVAFSPSSPGVVYAGSASAFHRSADGGAHWTRYTLPSGWIWGPPGVRAGVPIDVVVDPDDPNLLYANNYGGGVFRSTDGAQTWSVWSQGYSGADVHAAVIAGGDTANVFAIGRSGPFKSANYGVDWVGIGNGAADFAEWYSVAVQPGHPNVVLLSDEHQGVILRSTDGGGNFVEVVRNPGAQASDPTKREGFKALVFAPSDGRIVYAGMAKDRGTIDNLASPPLGNVLYKSTDGGATWGVPSTDLDGKSVYRFRVDPADASRVLAATSRGVFRTTDGGASWQFLPSFGDKMFAAIAVDPTDANKIVASEKYVGIWVSEDGGSTCHGPFNANFTSTPPSVLALAFDPAGSGTLYAADYYSGVYSVAGGVTGLAGGNSWSKFPDSSMTGLTVRAVKDLALAGGVIYATTQGGGVFRLGGPAVVPSPSQAAFPSLVVGSPSTPRTITLHNTSTAVRTITGKTPGGAQGGDFAIANDACSGSMPGGSVCSFDVVFTPSGPGSRTASISIASDDPSSPYAISVVGAGLAAVSVSPGSVTVSPRGGQAFTASGGSGAGYTWSLVTNASGGTIDASTGAYTAGSTPSVNDVVRVTDSLGNSGDRNVTVTAGLSILPATVTRAPRAAQAFTASGGSGTGYAWSLTTNGSGGTIDPSTGAYSAGAAGSVLDVVRLTDSLGSIATRNVAVTAGVSITPGVAGMPPGGSQTFAARGGSGAGYAWSLSTNASGGTIDAGTGGYRAGSTPGVTDVVRAVDSLGNVATASVSVTQGVSITASGTSAPPRGGLSFAAHGGSGAGYAWSLSTNASGGTIDAASGAYTAGATPGATDVVRVTDSLSNVATQSVSVTAGVSITASSTTAAPRGSLSFAAHGG